MQRVFVYHIVLIRYQKLRNYSFTYLEIIMLSWTATAGVGFIWMWILESLQYANIISTSYCLNMVSTKDTKHFVNTFTAIQI